MEDWGLILVPLMGQRIRRVLELSIESLDGRMLEQIGRNSIFKGVEEKGVRRGEKSRETGTGVTQRLTLSIAHLIANT